jgi:cysteine-rich repeat protein
VADGTACNDQNNCTLSSNCSNGVCTGIDRECEGVCGDGILAADEECDDGNTEDGDCCNSQCRFEGNAVMCRPAQGQCDAPEYCPVNSALCPADIKQNGTVCRPAKGPCDAPEYL